MYEVAKVNDCREAATVLVKSDFYPEGTIAKIIKIDLGGEKTSAVTIEGIRFRCLKQPEIIDDGDFGEVIEKLSGLIHKLVEEAKTFSFRGKNGETIFLRKRIERDQDSMRIALNPAKNHYNNKPISGPKKEGVKKMGTKLTAEEKQEKQAVLKKEIENCIKNQGGKLRYKNYNRIYQAAQRLFGMNIRALLKEMGYPEDALSYTVSLSKPRHQTERVTRVEGKAKDGQIEEMKEKEPRTAVPSVPKEDKNVAAGKLVSFDDTVGFVIPLPPDVIGGLPANGKDGNHFFMVARDGSVKRISTHLVEQSAALIILQATEKFHCQRAEEVRCALRLLEEKAQ